MKLKGNACLVTGASGGIGRAIERGRRQVLEGRALGLMNLIAPRLLDALFYRFMVAPRK